MTKSDIDRHLLLGRHGRRLQLYGRRERLKVMLSLNCTNC